MKNLLSGLFFAFILGVSSVGVFNQTGIEDTTTNFLIFVVIYSVLGNTIYHILRVLED